MLEVPRVLQVLEVQCQGARVLVPEVLNPQDGSHRKSLLGILCVGRTMRRSYAPPIEARPV